MKLSNFLDMFQGQLEIPIVPMPNGVEIHNACSERCDMLFGPCACGAWHFGEHIEHFKEENKQYGKKKS